MTDLEQSSLEDFVVETSGFMTRDLDVVFVAITLAQVLLVGFGALLFSRLDLSSLFFGQEWVSFEEVLSWTEI